MKIKNKTMEKEMNKNRGGRNARKDADYFNWQAKRPAELKHIKNKYGSKGIDYYVSTLEKLIFLV